MYQKNIHKARRQAGGFKNRGSQDCVGKTVCTICDSPAAEFTRGVGWLAWRVLFGILKC